MLDSIKEAIGKNQSFQQFYTYRSRTPETIGDSH
jgi:hypothetical protein